MWYEKLQKLSWLDAILISGVMMVVAGLGMSIRDNLSDKNEIILEKGGHTGPPVLMEAVIDIDGEVLHPGVYILPAGSRINDALAVAGGLAVNADREWVANNLNKAELLRDGMKIIIPRIKSQETNSKTQANNNTQITNSKQILGTKTEMNGLISLNNATVEELDKLPGVGPAMAGKIIDYRNKNGGFRNIEEIKLVSGIGDKMFENIRELISL